MTDDDVVCVRARARVRACVCVRACVRTCASGVRGGGGGCFPFIKNERGRKS